eukprot:480549_1
MDSVIVALVNVSTREDICINKTHATLTHNYHFMEIFDALHFHLFHCFEAGLRVRRSDDNGQIEEEEKCTNDQYFDAEFARMNRRILERHRNTASYDRFA